MKDFTDEDDKHGEEEQQEKHDQSPHMAGSDVTHSLYRSPAYVTRTCADVTDTAAVAVFLQSTPFKTSKFNTFTLFKAVGCTTKEYLA